MVILVFWDNSASIISNSDEEAWSCGKGDAIGIPLLLSKDKGQCSCRVLNLVRGPNFKKSILFCRLIHKMNFNK